MTSSASDIVEVDARGLGNPTTFIHVAKSTRYLSRGTTVVVRADDDSAAIDFPAWAEWAGHAIDPIEPAPEGGYLVRLEVLKGSRKTQHAVESSLASRKGMTR
ncbi:MAG: sulfurtransferase TusA family protein [Demequinaceae bacterium]|nr:sulfurtransferase TusA family protein [Demequinaceae bacterium]